MTRLLALLALLLPLPLFAAEDTPEPPMTLERLDAIIRALDPEAQTNGSMWQLTVNEVTVLIVTDESADRMRAITPVRKAEEVTPEEMTRLMQANFDSALDARYAIARDVLWSAFIHPLKPLEKNQLISGIGQVVNLAQSYGTLYSGGALQYGDGDSGALQRALIDDLLSKGEEI
ncbi:type III secretion system chaperone [Roseovarius autotrophicus]|uniref:type III secretion system chaperone n=1 Tax=Roseovarius autotrophicus TaxID=2824121 RepID=UPI001A0D4809|nr:type III secretion system chaperone [Roseovarius autotrophicus]MBE0452360.1 type III secretion system chaperone [Roseovarius sp.]